MFQRAPGVPDMLYMSRSYYGRSNIRCTGPKSCTAMCLCIIVPFIVFLASTFLFYDISGAIELVSYCLFGVAGVLFILMVVLCAISWHKGCEYTKQNPQMAGQMNVVGVVQPAPATQSMNRTRVRGPPNQIHGAPPKPPSYQIATSQPPTAPPAYNSAASRPAYPPAPPESSVAPYRPPSGPPPTYTSPVPGQQPPSHQQLYPPPPQQGPSTIQQQPHHPPAYSQPSSQQGYSYSDPTSQEYANPV